MDNPINRWIVAQPPTGFDKVTELKRPLAGRAQPVPQIVYSDGLASLSIFVEPNASPARGTVQSGAILSLARAVLHRE